MNIQAIGDFITKFPGSLSWPILIFFLAGKFSNQISNLISRITKLDVKGLSAEIESQKNTPQEIEDYKKIAQEAEKKYKVMEEKIRDLDVNAKNNITYYQIRYEFEKLYRLIFGTQLGILLFANLSPDKKVQVRTVLTQYQNSPISSSYPYNDYVNFLVASQLLQDAGNDEYLITKFGTLFLEYLTQNNIPLLKAN